MNGCYRMLLSDPSLHPSTAWFWYINAVFTALHCTCVALVLSTPGGNNLAGWFDSSTSRSGFNSKLSSQPQRVTPPLGHIQALQVVVWKLSHCEDSGQIV